MSAADTRRFVENLLSLAPESVVVVSPADGGDHELANALIVGLPNDAPHREELFAWSSRRCQELSRSRLGDLNWNSDIYTRVLAQELEKCPIHVVELDTDQRYLLDWEGDAGWCPLHTPLM